MSKKIVEKSESKSPFYFRNIDLFVPMLFLMALITPIRAVLSQYYLLSYQDDIMWVHWVSENIGQPISLLSHGPGSGYRVTVNLLFGLGYSIWGGSAAGYYLLNGLLLAGSMIFLYLLVKSLADRLSAVISVLFYLFLDASFILAWKFNFITFTSELFFITSALYFFIQYFQHGNQNKLYIAAVLSMFAFFSKEPSIVIIPAVNMLYLFHKWHSLPLSDVGKKVILVLNVAPVLILASVMLLVDNAFGPSSSGSLMELFSERLLFYMGQEVSWQMKNPYLLVIACLGAFYFHAFKKDAYYGRSIVLLKNISFILVIAGLFLLFRFVEVSSMMGALVFVALLISAFILGDLNHRIGIAWFAIALFPLLITSLPVQPTYLAEPNLGMAIFIGTIISGYLKHFLSSFNNSSKAPLSQDVDKHERLLVITVALIVTMVLLAQVLVIPTQISNTNSYHEVVSDRQTSFKEAIDYIVSEVPENGTIYYIPNQKRAEINAGQINSLDLYQLICLEGRCDININYLDGLNVNIDENNKGYIVLLSSFDIYILNTQYPQLLNGIKDSEAKIVTNGAAQAAVIKL